MHQYITKNAPNGVFHTHNTHTMLLTHTAHAQHTHTQHALDMHSTHTTHTRAFPNALFSRFSNINPELMLDKSPYKGTFRYTHDVLTYNSQNRHIFRAQIWPTQ